ncbi:MAG: hypothetical protein HWN66_16090 [Candidatus Helarchaeota archaeon]|nr:hypothetical protein [Candidatus Helarchaeota archaeon]
MIYEIYIIGFQGGIPYIDKTYRKIHLGIHNTLVSGLLHVVYTMFDTEMEIGHIKSMETKDYKLIYLKHQDLLFVALADIQLDESKIQIMLNNIATSFYDDYKDTLANWSKDLMLFQPFIRKMDSILSETIAELFFEEYPTNIVKLADYINKNYTLEYQELIGKALAEKILTERFSNIVKKRNLKRELSKFTVVKNLTDDIIELSVCPFCRKKHSTKPICNFVSGFIKGMLQSDVWVEKTCVGRGDASCSFSKEL